MGQYYKPTNVDTKEHLVSHSYGSGLKLMEHSWLENRFVEAVEVLLTKFGPWHKASFVWAGDYADHEEGYEKTAEGYDQNLYSIGAQVKLSPFDIDKIKEDNKINFNEYRYIVNHTLKRYVDKKHLTNGENDWVVHPLPLLTAEGNGRGGGDYYETLPDIEKVGTWARHSISIENEIPEGYEEEIVLFKE